MKYNITFADFARFKVIASKLLGKEEGIREEDFEENVNEKDIKGYGLTDSQIRRFDLSYAFVCKKCSEDFDFRDPESRVIFTKSERVYHRCDRCGEVF